MALTVEVAVFVNTNLGTRMAMDVSPDITARDLKSKQKTKTRLGIKVNFIPIMHFKLQILVSLLCLIECVIFLVLSLIYFCTSTVEALVVSLIS